MLSLFPWDLSYLRSKKSYLLGMSSLVHVLSDESMKGWDVALPVPSHFFLNVQSKPILLLYNLPHILSLPSFQVIQKMWGDPG